MHFDNVFGNRQSEPRAALSLGARAVYLVELVEDTLTLLMRDARAGIADAHYETAILRTGRDAYFTRIREFDGVADQIEQDLGKTRLIAKPVGQPLCHVSPDGEFLGGGERLGCHTY